MNQRPKKAIFYLLNVSDYQTPIAFTYRRCRKSVHMPQALPIDSDNAEVCATIELVLVEKEAARFIAHHRFSHTTSFARTTTPHRSTENIALKLPLHTPSSPRVAIKHRYVVPDNPDLLECARPRYLQNPALKGRLATHRIGSDHG